MTAQQALLSQPAQGASLQALQTQPPQQHFHAYQQGIILMGFGLQTSPILSSQTHQFRQWGQNDF